VSPNASSPQTSEFGGWALYGIGREKLYRTHVNQGLCQRNTRVNKRPFHADLSGRSWVLLEPSCGDFAAGFDILSDFAKTALFHPTFWQSAHFSRFLFDILSGVFIDVAWD
jgi:hypothetical protein